MGGLFDRIGNVFRREPKEGELADTDPPPADDNSMICMAALAIGVILMVRR